MDPLDKLFAFPVVMIDAESEEHRKTLALQGDEDSEIIVGEVEYPYYDFNGIGDRWLPTGESIQRAREGKFDACTVTFVNVGNFLVPWSRAKFKKKIKEFISSLNLEPEKSITLMLTTDRDNLKELKDEIEDGEGNK